MIQYDSSTSRLVNYNTKHNILRDISKEISREISHRRRPNPRQRWNVNSNTANIQGRKAKDENERHRKGSLLTRGQQNNFSKLESRLKIENNTSKKKSRIENEDTSRTMTVKNASIFTQRLDAKTLIPQLTLQTWGFPSIWWHLINKHNTVGFTQIWSTLTSPRVQHPEFELNFKSVQVAHVL